MRPVAIAAMLVALQAALTAAPVPGQPQPLSPIVTAPAPAPEKKPVPRVQHRRWLKADARVCLEFPTDMQVVKCSEKYR